MDICILFSDCLVICLTNCSVIDKKVKCCNAGYEEPKFTT